MEEWSKKRRKKLGKQRKGEHPLSVGVEALWYLELELRN